MTKKILLAVSGSIAAYKAADLSHHVNVLMTNAAKQFIPPLTLQVLSKNPVYSNVMKEDDPQVINHIALAKQADLFLLAPASANTLAHLAHGFADNIVTSVALALPLEVPKFFAPAMNTKMYENPITQSNIALLKKFGYKEIQPKSSVLACGDVGSGALADLDTIIQKIEEQL